MGEWEREKRGTKPQRLTTRGAAMSKGGREIIVRMVPGTGTPAMPNYLGGGNRGHMGTPICGVGGTRRHPWH